MTESNGISAVVALAFAGPATFCAPTVMVASSNAARRAPVERRMIPPSVARGTMNRGCAQPNDLLDRLQIFFRSLSRHRAFGSGCALYSARFTSPAVGPVRISAVFPGGGLDDSAHTRHSHPHPFV